MDMLLFSMVAEVATVVILLLVLILLYRFSSIKYFRDFSIAFSLYLFLIILALVDPLKNQLVMDGLMNYVLLLLTSCYLLKPFINLKSKTIRRWNISFFCILNIILPFIILIFNRPEMLEGVAYIILGFACIMVGFFWMKDVLSHLLATKVVGITFIFFGLHLMDFIIFQYDETSLAFGYLVASTFEVIIALCLIFLNFAYLKEQDAINYGRYSNLFNNASDAILIINDDVISDCNIKAEELFETTRNNIIGLKPMDFSSPIQENGRDSYEYGTELFQSASEGKITQFDWIHMSAKGNKKICEIALFRIEEQQFAAIIRDMTDKYAYEEAINFHKYYDALTHLPKRELFIDRLARSLEERYQQVALIAFNVDNFKEINDEYGHEVGDDLLIMITQRLIKVFNSDLTMTRLGGDEFVLMMDKLTHMNLIYLPLEKVQSIFSHAFEIENYHINISACIGVAFPETRETPAMDLLKNVDLALNLAKSKGRGRLEFYSLIEKEIFTKRVGIERDMRRGIDRGEFIPFYQPIIHSKTGEILGAEALARWIKSDGKLVYPDIFIPIAEETDLIGPIGKSILFQACKACKNFLEVIPDFVMHVNLSPLQLQDESIITILKEAMEESKITARHLAVEITETVFIDNASRANHILKQIRDLGIGVALDDFGTGYSSLSYLVEMQVDTIKVDRSFVIKLPKDKKSKAMIEYLTGLMHELGYEIIVEGVEEKDQSDFLKTLGCDFMQGYYFHRPMAYEALSNLLFKNRKPQ